MASYCDPITAAVSITVADNVIYSPCHGAVINTPLTVRHCKQNCTILLRINVIKENFGYRTTSTRDQKLKGALKVVKG